MKPLLYASHIVASLCMVFLSWQPLPAADAGSRPNIVFILADDLGYTDLACYGSRYYETPHLDRLAADGMKFSDGYTCGPNCQPTRAALMSGQYGPRTGVYTVGSIERFNWRSRTLRPVDNVQSLPLEKITIAQALRSGGYATGIFGKWHLGQSGEYHPAERGFDEAIVSMGRHFDFVTVPKVDVPPGAYLADFLSDKAADFIRRHRQQPFFLYLAHFGVHSPYEAKPELIERFRQKEAVGGHRDPTYAAMIASVDESVGRVRNVLDELGLSEETLIIFSSDNGGVGGYERAGVANARGVTDNSPLRGGKGMLYEGGIRVPFLFCWPGKIAAGSRCDEPINSVDLYPTLLELAAVKPPPAYVLDGASYFDLLLGKPGSVPRAPIYWHFPGYLGAGAGSWRTTPVGAIRAGEWKLLEFFEDHRLELYNLRDDLGEQQDLASLQPDRVRQLRGQLAAWREAIQAPMPQAKTAEDNVDSPRPSAAKAKKKRKAR